jgi:cellulose synthase (UDP-forming)
LVVGGLFLAIAIALNRFQHRTATLAMVMLSMFASARYLVWRITQTVELSWTADMPTTVMASLLLFAECYTFLVLLLGYLQTVAPLNRKPIALPQEPEFWPTVDILIPTFNEPLDVVRPTILAARALEWPEDKINIYLCDDGRRPEFRKFAQQAGINYLTRSDNKHAKAGNLNLALKQCKGDFVTIFDCDHIPTRSFLQAAMGWLIKDKRLAMVQLPHHFYTPDPFERNLSQYKDVPNEGELFYGLIQRGNDLWNAVFFCGSCAVMRRTALDDVGGIAVETVTEDAHTALRLHRKGWHTAFIDVPQASGLATESLSAHVGQRIRWARGMVQIFRTDNPLFGRGLTLSQRLCYASAMVHFLFGIPRILFLLAPLAYLFLGTNIFNAAPILVFAYALPHLAHSIMTNSRLQGKFRHSFWAEVYETVLSVYIAIPTTVALIAPNMGSFNVTAKGGINKRDYFDFNIATPHLVLAALNLTGVGMGLYALQVGSAEPRALYLNIFWACYNLVVLGAALSVAWEKKQVRHTNRIDLSLPANLYRVEDGRSIHCMTENLSLGGGLVSGVDLPPMQKGEELILGIEINQQEYPVSAEVVEHSGSQLRVKFPMLDGEDEERLVFAMFCRSNAWESWHDDHEVDRPMSALTRILGHAFRGLGRTIPEVVRMNQTKKGAA